MTNPTSDRHREAAQRLVIIGTVVKPCGQVSMIGWISGERYYWLRDSSGSVSMMPADVVEAQHERTTRTL